MSNSEQIREFVKRGQKAQKAVDKVLEDQAELAKPEPCKTCGGTERAYPEAKTRELRDIPCPDCQKPEPTGFSKSYGRILDAVVIAFATMDDKIVQQQVQVAVDWGRKAKTIIDSQQAELEKHRWIPVSERVPEKNGDYLVRWDTGILEMIHFTPKFSAFSMKTNVSEVTHWKPIILPEQALSEDK